MAERVNPRLTALGVKKAVQPAQAVQHVQPRCKVSIPEARTLNPFSSMLGEVIAWAGMEMGPMATPGLTVASSHLQGWGGVRVRGEGEG